MDTKKLFGDFSKLVENMSSDEIVKSIEDAARHTANNYISRTYADNKYNSFLWFLYDAWWREQ